MSSKLFRMIGFVVALAGLALLLATPRLGEAAGQAILAQHGGSMDTTAWLAQMEAAVSSYRAVGGILLGVGLFRSLQD